MVVVGERGRRGEVGLTERRNFTCQGCVGAGVSERWVVDSLVVERNNIACLYRRYQTFACFRLSQKPRRVSSIHFYFFLSLSLRHPREVRRIVIVVRC